MTHKPLISVVTVCFNAAKCIVPTVKSVVNQTYTDYEYIVIDGGSTDGTLDVIKSFSNRINVLISEPDNGVFEAMNKALKHARGEWICFMNAGDSFYSSSVLQQVASYMLNPLIMLYGDTEYVRVSGKKIEVAAPVRYIHKNMPTSHQSFFVRTEMARETGFNLKYRYASDYNMVYHLFQEYGAERVAHVPVTVSSYEAITGMSKQNEVAVYGEATRIKRWSAYKCFCILNYVYKRIAQIL